MSHYHKTTAAELGDDELEKPWAGRFNPQWVCTVRFTKRGRCIRGPGAVPLTEGESTEWTGAAACLYHLGPAIAWRPT